MQFGAEPMKHCCSFPPSLITVNALSNQVCVPNSFTERFWQNQPNSKIIPVSTKGISSVWFLQVF